MVAASGHDDRQRGALAVRVGERAGDEAAEEAAHEEDEHRASSANAWARIRYGATAPTIGPTLTNAALVQAPARA